MDWFHSIHEVNYYATVYSGFFCKLFVQIFYMVFPARISNYISTTYQFYSMVTGCAPNASLTQRISYIETLAVAE